MISVRPAVSVHSRIREIGREAWDACAANPDYMANPFVAFDFLDALEEANCAVEHTGWGPRHLSVLDEAGQVAAVMPLYLKSHSQGEYVFDHSWADAYERAGGAYYPKLLCASPFSPVTGPRLLVRPGVDADEARRVLLGGDGSRRTQSLQAGLHAYLRWVGGGGERCRQGCHRRRSLSCSQDGKLRDGNLGDTAFLCSSFVFSSLPLRVQPAQRP